MKRNGTRTCHTEEHGTGFVRGQGNIDCPFGWSCVVELHEKVTPKGQQYLIQKYLGCTPLDLEAGA